MKINKEKIKLLLAFLLCSFASFIPNIAKAEYEKSTVIDFGDFNTINGFGKNQYGKIQKSEYNNKSDFYAKVTINKESFKHEGIAYGISKKIENKNWSNYKYIEFDVYNKNNSNTWLGLKVDSKEKTAWYSRQLKYNDITKIQIILNKDEIDLENVEKITFFRSTPYIFKSPYDKEVSFDISSIKITNSKLNTPNIETENTIGFDNRIKIYSESNFYSNWELEISQNNNLIKKYIDENTKNPKWIHTFIKSGKYDLKMVCRSLVGEKKEIFKTINIIVNKEEKIWLWNNHSSLRSDFYETKLNNNLSEIELNLVSNQDGAVQIPFIANFDANVKFKINSELQSKIYRVGYLNTKETRDFYLINKHGWIPDVLSEQDNYNIKAGNLETAFIELKSPKITKFKTIKSEIVANIGNITKRIHLKINLYPINLENITKLKTAFSTYPDQMEYTYKDQSSLYKNKLDKLIIDHSITPDFIYRGKPLTIDEVKEIEEKTKETFTNLQHFNIETKIEEFDKTIDGLKPIVNYIVENNLQDKYYFFIFDESFEDSFPKMKFILNSLKTNFPKIQIISTSRVRSILEMKKELENIDHWVPATSEFYKSNDSLSKWWYLFIAVRPPFLNWFLESNLIESRLLGWQSYQNDIDGILYYTINRWTGGENKNPIKKSDFPMLSWNPKGFESANGDGVLIYAGENDILPSLRLKNFHYGLQDYKLFKYAENILGDELLRDIANVTLDMKNYSIESNVFESTRKNILEKLKKLK